MSSENADAAGLKALVGICGIGYGHSIRQRMVIESLIKRDFQVAVFCFGKSLEILARRGLPHVPFWEVHVPWVFAGPGGIDWERTERNDLAHSCRKNQLTIEAFRGALAFFGGTPDICISDYEPVAASFAYEHGVPLVTIDQQSKFLGYQTRNLGELSREEERARLSYFFPYAEARYACSFYPVQAARDKEFSVELVPAPVRPEVAAMLRDDNKLPRVEKRDNLALVYCSPYGPTAQEPSEIIEILSGFRDWRFLVYANTSDWQAAGQSSPRNIELKAFDRQNFARDEAAASCLISTAGHTLLSEAVYLKTPLYAIPLSTYDQHYCAQMVDQYQIGASHSGVSTPDLQDFFSSLPALRKKLAECSALTTSPAISSTMLDSIVAIARAHAGRNRPARRATAPGRAAVPSGAARDRLFLPDLAAMLSGPPAPRSARYASIVVKPTMKCTCNCLACQPRSKSWWDAGAPSLTPGQWHEVLQQASGLGVKVVTISGGEPLLYPSLAELVSSARECGMAPILNTNGIRLLPPVLDQLCDRGLQGINFSLDSPRPSIHDALRRRRGAWRQCVDTIRSAGAHDGQIWYAIRMVLTARTLMDLPEMIRLAAGLGATSLKLSYLEWGQDGSPLLPSLETLRGFKETVIPCCLEVLKSLEIPQRPRAASISIIENLLFPEETNTLENYAQGTYWSQPAYPRHCSLPYSQVIIYGDGSVLPCNAGEYTRFALPGNLTTHTLKEILDGQAMSDFCANLTDSCQYCPMPLHLTLPLRENMA